MIHQMARLGVADGRPMVCLYFSDCDPSGYGMPISLSRKLQAFTLLDFPDLDWQVHRAALTPEHVRTMGLPSTPLKPSERRAGKWFDRFGLEQTEIDSLATLRPDDLRRIVRDVVKPFRDRTLDGRVDVAATTGTAQCRGDPAHRQLGRGCRCRNATFQPARTRTRPP
jgi:hypothetical protein